MGPGHCSTRRMARKRETVSCSPSARSDEGRSAGRRRGAFGAPKAARSEERALPPGALRQKGGGGAGESRDGIGVRIAGRCPDSRKQCGRWRRERAALAVSPTQVTAGGARHTCGTAQTTAVVIGLIRGRADAARRRIDACSCKGLIGAGQRGRVSYRHGHHGQDQRQHGPEPIVPV